MNYEHYRAAEEFVPARAGEVEHPAWHGRRASAAIPPQWWSVPRDGASHMLPIARDEHPGWGRTLAYLGFAILVVWAVLAWVIR